MLPGLQLCTVWSPGQARQAPPPGKSTVRTHAPGATAPRGLVARTGASSAASGEIHRPNSRSRGYSSARSGSPDKARQAPPPGNPPSALMLPGLQLCTVWSPGQARQAPPPGKSTVRTHAPGATAPRGLVARTGASSAASGEIHRPNSRSRGYSSARSGSPDKARQAPPPGKSTIRAHAYRGYSSAWSGSPDRRVKRRLRENAG